MPEQATLDPYHDERRLSFDRSYTTPEYATYGTQTYARSDPYLAVHAGAVPNPASFVRRQSPPAETGGTTSSLLPLDQAVRLDRERTVRAASTTALPSWPSGHYGPGNPSSPSSSSANTPFAPSSTFARAAGPTTPTQQTPTRKLTKHRRSSSGFGRAAGPPLPTSLAHSSPHFSPAAPPSWQATNLHESAAVPRPYIVNSPYPPPSSSLRPNSSYAQSQQSIAQTPAPPQAGYHTFRPSDSLHLSPYPPVRPPLPSLPVRTESEEQQVSFPPLSKKRKAHPLTCHRVNRSNEHAASLSRPSKPESPPSPPQKTTSSSSPSPSPSPSRPPHANATASQRPSCARWRK